MPPRSDTAAATLTHGRIGRFGVVAAMRASTVRDMTSNDSSAHDSFAQNLGAFPASRP
jgi:hypothetical protein